MIQNYVELGVAAITDGRDTGSWQIGRQCSNGASALLLLVFEEGLIIEEAE